MHLPDGAVASVAEQVPDGSAVTRRATGSGPADVVIDVSEQWRSHRELAAGAGVEVIFIAGEAFLTSIPEDVEASGMAVVCASAPFRPDLEARRALIWAR